MITYKKGDIFKNLPQTNYILAHICNNKGGWGAGFTYKLSDFNILPEVLYKLWYKDKYYNQTLFQLGATQYVKLNNSNSIVANMIAQNGYKTKENPIPLDYKALEECIKQLIQVSKANNLPIYIPKIGTGLAGGDWNQIEDIIKTYLTDYTLDFIVFEF